jgi:hypothetical protein
MAMHGMKMKKKGMARGGKMGMKKKGYAKGGMKKKGYAKGGMMKKKGMARGGAQMTLAKIRAAAKAKGYKLVKA